MKKSITTIITLAILLASCSDTTESLKTEMNEAQGATPQVEEMVHNDGDESPNLMYKEGEIETENEELLNMEGSEVEGDDRFDNMCMDKTVSDCYIVSHFTEMDATYITVDFVNYSITETDNGPELELVNVIKTLRTFLVDQEYDDCSGEHSARTEEMLKAAENNRFTLFRIETDGGIVEQLFEKKCDN